MVGTARSRPDLRRAAAVGALAFVVFNLNFRPIWSGDTLGTRYQPFAIWLEGSLHLDSVLEAAGGDFHRPYWIAPSRDGRHAMTYPLATALAVTPLYAPAVLYVAVRGATTERLRDVGYVTEKLVASFITALATGGLYWVLRRWVPVRDAVWLALAFAFATTTWVVSSQALWQHGLGQLLVIAALGLGGLKGSRYALFGLGAVCALMVASRPPNALLAAAFLGAVTWRERGRAWPAWLAGGVTLGAFLGLNLWVYGHVTGGYGTHYTVSEAVAFHYRLPYGPALAAMLASPAKGLLFYSPFLLLLPWGVRAHWRSRDPDRRRMAIFALLGIGAQFWLYGQTDPRAGWCWGPRYLTDQLPLWLWLMAPALPAASRLVRVLFLAACLWGAAIQAVAAFKYYHASDLALEREPERVWSWREPPVLIEWRQPWQRFHILELAGVPARWTNPNTWFGREGPEPLPGWRFHPEGK